MPLSAARTKSGPPIHFADSGLIGSLAQLRGISGWQPCQRTRAHRFKLSIMHLQREACGLFSAKGRKRPRRLYMEGKQ
jgi:hypothetical protein